MMTAISNSYQDYFMEREQTILYSHVGRDETKTKRQFWPEEFKKQTTPLPQLFKKDRTALSMFKAEAATDRQHSLLRRPCRQMEG